MAEEAPAPAPAEGDGPLIGVLALQGSVEEHVSTLEKLGARTREIRVAAQVAGVDGLVLPGGESTAMGIMSEGDGLFEALRAAVRAGTPTYGTCAGMILLADDCVGQRTGGQALVGGLEATVCRNYFGAQVSSFECPLVVAGGDAEKARLAAAAYPAVFIRAPAILRCGPGVEALATVTAAPCPAAAPAVEAFRKDASEPAPKKRRSAASSSPPPDEVVVAARQGHLLATAFHPELTEDLRWHAYFLDMVKEKAASK